jgi:hypothetical protein
MFFCFLVSCGGVRLSPLGTSANIWPIVTAPDDKWWWMWSSRWSDNWQGKPKYSEKTCPSATLSTTNPTWPELGSNPGRRGGKPATNRLSYGTALALCYMYKYNCRFHIWEPVFSTSVNTPASYFGGPGLEFVSEHRPTLVDHGICIVRYFNFN